MQETIHTSLLSEVDRSGIINCPEEADDKAFGG